ncbi:MAG: hypothetical protein V4722_17300 [Bacteroidota bacterium]
MNNTTISTDITDSLHDQQRLQADEAIIDLPGVKDIPGQEHVRPLPAGEMADATASSSDEEGKGLLDNLSGEEDEEIMMDDEVNVTESERELLDNAATQTDDEDDMGLNRAALDNTDEDGDPLNEGSSADDISGADLDIPGSELDDDNEDIGEEDEENNVYSTAQK